MDSTTLVAILAIILIPPLILILTIVVAAVVVKRRLERKRVEFSEQLRQRSRATFEAQGLSPEQIEVRINSLAATVGDRIARLAEERNIDLEEARQLFFRRTANLAELLDSKVKLPFGLSFGLDFILGLVPVAGGFASALAATVVVLNSLQYGIPVAMIVRMAANIAIDYVIGLVPVVGDVADLFFRANNRNVSLLEGHLAQQRRELAATGAVATG